MTGRRLSRDYLQWEKQPDDLVAQAITTGLIVLDANVLLSLYEVTTSARDEVIGVLDRVADRLWIPHQVAVEYSRNRSRVVIGREQMLSRARAGVTAAPNKAAAVVAQALKAVRQANERTRSGQPWASTAAAQLNDVVVRKTISDLLQPAVAELDRLAAEHDIAPRDVHASDHIFERVDSLLTGKIGELVDHETRRGLVQTALLYRFPNNIPPGGGDVEKPTELEAAGDYLLWWEVLRHAGQESTPDHVVIVTADTKSDWWTLDESEKPRHPRPELGQELFERTGRRLVLLSSPQFVSAAHQHLGTTLSQRTVDEITTVLHAVADLSAGTMDRSARFALGAARQALLVREVAAAFRRLGFEFDDNIRSEADGELSSDRLGLSERVSVEVKSSGRPLRETEVEGVRRRLITEAPGESLLSDPATTTERVILVAKGGFTIGEGPFEADDRIYLMGPTELNSLLAGVASGPVFEWLLGNLSDVVDLDG